MSFEIGDRVELVKPHLFHGREYQNEAEVGDLGTVILSEALYSDDKPYTHVKWDHPRQTKNSNVDNECLELETTEAELDAEAARLFGLA